MRALWKSWGALLPLLVSAVVASAHCDGCSEACSNDNLGAAGCTCQSDQDCATSEGIVFLCVEGKCAEGDPADAPAVIPCGDDGDCPQGQACGVDRCFAAPACQRIEVPALRLRVAGGAPADMTSDFNDCTHTWSSAVAPVFTATFTIDLQGNMDLGDAGGDCASGSWFAAQRVGELVCAGIPIAVAPPDVTACVEPDCGATAGCAVVGGSVGVCR